MTWWLTLKNSVASWIAYRLPVRVAYWAFLRVSIYGTVPPYGNQIVGDLTCLEAMGRWSTDKKLYPLPEPRDGDAGRNPCSLEV